MTPVTVLAHHCCLEPIPAALYSRYLNITHTYEVPPAQVPLAPMAYIQPGRTINQTHTSKVDQTPETRTHARTHTQSEIVELLVFVN